MITMEPLIVHVERQKNGFFFLQGTMDKRTLLTPLELKKRLFIWHEYSFYGTGLGEAMDSRSGLFVSPYMAMNYLASDSAALHGTVEWSPELQLLRQVAVIYRQAMEEGWFVPSFEQWRQGRTGWELKLPEQAETPYRQLMEEANKRKVDYLDNWFQGALNELIESESALSSAWSQLRTEQPMLRLLDMAAEVDATSAEANAASGNQPRPLQQARNAWLDEEEWLVAIGWKQDDVPFRTCLQLVEPGIGAEESVSAGSDAGTSDYPASACPWRLQLILQDKKDSNVLREIDISEIPASDSQLEKLPDHWRPHYNPCMAKDRSKLVRIVPMLRQDERPDRIVTALTDDQAWTFMEESSLQLLQAGYSVLLPAWWEELRKYRPKLKANLKSSTGSGRESMVGLGHLMQFDWKVAVGDMDLSEEEFMRMAAEKKRMMFIRGKWIQLDPAFLEQVRQAMKRVDRERGLSFRDVLELHLLNQEDETHASYTEGAAGSGSPSEELQIQVGLNRQMREFMRKLQLTKQIPVVPTSPLLQAELRNYQREGLSWLLFLRDFGLGGCLADDMGLGKTIQFIAYLLHVKETREAGRGEQPNKQSNMQSNVQSDKQSKEHTCYAPPEEHAPALLICPTSVLGNWQKELEKFAPSLRVHLHYGPQRAKAEAFAESVRGMDLVMTSYSLSYLDESELSGVHWDHICLDEAQNIKNAYTKQSAAIRKLDANHRIALTGTPIENRLTELWSIFDFINPGYLGNLRSFTHNYVNPIEKDRDEQRITQIQKLVRPFLLRREKKDPAIRLDLPDKNEMKAYVSLTVEQGAMYENVVQSLMDKIDTLSGIEKKGLILATLTKLKQVCDHPALLLKETGQIVWEDRSAKMMRLLEMLDELRSEGDNCLIFTQFVDMGHILQAAIEQERGEPVQFLHGGVPKVKRDRMIERFQNTELPSGERCGIFILSLKAGGTGLNLTAANHVFHFDRWWNPAVENQATDRAFRIGQTKDVQVHKFVTLGTLEERIDAMIERKQGLSQQIIGAGENWVTEMSTDELRELFALRKEWIGK